MYYNIFPMKTIKAIFFLSLIIAGISCGDTENENTNNSEPVLSGEFELPKDPCQFFSSKMPGLFEFKKNDFMGDCEKIDNVYGVKTNILVNNWGIAIYLSAIPSNLADQKAVDNYYDRYLEIPDVKVEKLEGIAQGAIWMEKQKLLSFTEGAHTITLICSSLNDEENFNKNNAIKIAKEFMAYGMQ